MVKKLIQVFFLFFCSYIFGQKQTSDANFSDMLQQLLTHSVKEVLPDEISDINKTIFLDAREKREYKISHIKNSIWIDYDSFKTKRIKNISKNQPIVVYCSVGYRSEKIAEKLQQLGYTNVANLYGGIFEWVHKNKAVFRKNTKTNQIHTFNKEWSQWLQKGEKIY